MGPPHRESVRPLKDQPESGQAKTEAATQAAEQSPKVDRAKLEEAAAELSNRFDVKVEMDQDESTGVYVVRILSRDGERVIRQMPPESTLRMAEQARHGQLRGIVESVA